jgi:Ser/Thr protein kinase RdoA (MazF antagonist)
MDDPRAVAVQVLDQYGVSAAGLRPLGSGLINLTWLVDGADGQRRVLQRVAQLFPAEVNLDIDVIARRLNVGRTLVPGVLPTGTGALWVEAGGWTWRLMNWLPGDCHDYLQSPVQAASAGELLASFHRGLDGLQHSFANPRLGVHDTARHLATLRQALTAHADHPRFDHVAPIAREILHRAEELPELPILADRIVHGDPKINNMLFDSKRGVATALVDLDTVGPMPLPLELGDAMRSWCNPAGEDGRSGAFSRELFAAALAGYARVAGDWILPAEIAAIAPATETITIELAARFCADALNESYFGWDASRFATRGEHNELRAAGQLRLALSFAEQRDTLVAAARQAFAQT